MRKRIVGLAAALGLAIPLAGAALPAVASAHYAPQPPHISCGEIDGYFAGFTPGTTQVVIQHTTVDGVAQPDVGLTRPVSADGTFSTSNGFWNVDAAMHDVAVSFTWTTVENGRTVTGGSGDPVHTGVSNCPPPAPDLTSVVNNQQNQINLLQQEIRNSSQTIINKKGSSELVCKSRRLYPFLVRSKLKGSAVVNVTKALVRGKQKYAKVKKVVVGGKTRFRITADYRGVKAPKGQLRTVTVFVKLANGRTVRTVQFIRLCLPNDGNPNDTPTQGRADQ